MKRNEIEEAQGTIGPLQFARWPSARNQSARLLWALSRSVQSLLAS